MQISTVHSYAATPDAVVAMMADERWLTEVARRAGADHWEVSVDQAGSHVHAEVPAPEKAKRFTGPTLTIKLTINWPAANPDGSRDGRIDVRIPGMPASMSGSGRMTQLGQPDAPQTAIDYEAEFTINVPLIGKGLENAAAPYVLRVINTQQSVGNDYLAGKLD